MVDIRGTQQQEVSMRKKMLVSIDPELKDQFDAWAKENSVYKSRLIENMIRQFISPQRITVVQDEWKPKRCRRRKPDDQG
jgi:hypothetical protein